MIRIELPEAEAQCLEQLLRTTEHIKLRHRVQIVLMAHRGRPHPEIARDTGTSPRSVQRWLNAYLAGGPDALSPRKARGATPKLTEDLAPDLKRRVIDGPLKQGLDRANWTYAELADHLFKIKGIRVKKSAMQAFCRRHEIRPYRPTYRFLRGDPGKQAEAEVELAALKKGAEQGDLVLLSQDEARFPMVPTLCRTLGVKGHRPVVGTRDCKDLLYVTATVNAVTGRLHTNTLESSARAKQVTGKSKTRRMQEAFAAHLRHIGKSCPRPMHKRVVLIIDNAPWHRGKLIDEALSEHPHLEFKRLPSYSPQLNVIERLWKILRRRATHNRLFDTMADLKHSLRASLGYYQTVRSKIHSLIAGCYTPPQKQTELPGT